MRPVLAVLVAGRGTAAYRKLASAGLLLGRLHSLQGSFDGNQAFTQNGDSVEKTIEAVFVNRGWFRHNACHRINPEEGKSARWQAAGFDDNGLADHVEVSFRGATML
jgi:hypothetical protein